jgi:hypothetical protein
MAGYLGLVGYHWVDVQADLGDAWSLAAMAWAAAVLVTSWWPTSSAAADPSTVELPGATAQRAIPGTRD